MIEKHTVFGGNVSLMTPWMSLVLWPQNTIECHRNSYLQSLQSQGLNVVVSCVTVLKVGLPWTLWFQPAMSVRDGETKVERWWRSHGTQAGTQAYLTELVLSLILQCIPNFNNYRHTLPWDGSLWRSACTQSKHDFGCHICSDNTVYILCWNS